MTSGFAYDPDDDAVLGAPWNIALLSQRDVGLRVPINYVTDPAVSITAACFGSGRYEDYAATKCMSNLLSVGFRKLYLDLYWDSRRRVWSFCPVELPMPGEVLRHETIVVEAASSTTLMPTTITRTIPPSMSAAASTARLDPRQAKEVTTSDQDQSTSSTTIRKATLTVELSSSDSKAFATLPTTMPVDVDEVLYAVGSYRCSGTSAVDILTELIPSFLFETDDTLQAVMQYLIFNIHAAASIATPDAPAMQPLGAQLPSFEQLLGQYYRGNSSTYHYTPTLLKHDRIDLRGTWLNVDYETTAPLVEYFANGSTSTAGNGWPSSSYTEFRNQNHYRLLMGFGTVDPQMENYDFEGDAGEIFPPGYISDAHDTNQSPAGAVTDGCLFDLTRSSLKAANNSWALTAVDSTSLDADLTRAADAGYNYTLRSVSDLVACGYSVLLNTTLSGASADVNVVPYRDFAQSAIWSWTLGEPRNAYNLTTPEGAGKQRESQLRCATMNATTLGGRWQIDSCTASYHAACRVIGKPLMWTISSTVGNYSMSDKACPDNATFAAPRTALENRYLLAAYRNTSSDDNLPPLFININSLDVSDCWVTGVSAGCPYELSTDSSASIYVPSVAAVVILVLTVCLIIIKCGANRAHSRRRTKRGTDGWDYEGVPS